MCFHMPTQFKHILFHIHRKGIGLKLYNIIDALSLKFYMRTDIVLKDSYIFFASRIAAGVINRMYKDYIVSDSKML